MLFFFLGSCEHSLTDLQGNFSSPNYPSNYPNHLSCTWSITVTPNSYIYLQFSNFSLEDGGKDCRYDYVEVSDSSYPSSSIKIKHCGYQSPWCVWSTSNVLHVRFVTDHIVSASGFMAHYATYGNPHSGNCLSLKKSKEILTEHLQECKPILISVTKCPLTLLNFDITYIKKLAVIRH